MNRIDFQIDHRKALTSALAKLTFLERETIESIYLHGMSFGEVARRDGVSRSTIQARVRRGFARLRKDVEIASLYEEYHEGKN